MTDLGLFTLFLLLHVLAAIVAFGPVFVFPLIGAMGAQGADARELRPARQRSDLVARSRSRSR